MSLQDAERRYFGRAGWIAVGALIASAAFALLAVAVDVIHAVGDEAKADAQVPALIIEDK